MVRAIFGVQLARLQTKIESVLFLFGDFVPALREFPHHTAAVFAFGNRAFEMDVFQRMILHIDRQPHDAGPRRQPFGNSPRFQDAVLFQSQIIMQPGSMMPVNDKSASRSPHLIGWGEGRRRRLRCLVEAAFPGIAFELFRRFEGARTLPRPAGTLAPNGGEGRGEGALRLFLFRVNRRCVGGDCFPWVPVLHDPPGNAVKIERLGTFNRLQLLPMQRSRNRRAGKSAHAVGGDDRL